MKFSSLQRTLRSSGLVAALAGSVLSGAWVPVTAQDATEPPPQPSPGSAITLPDIGASARSVLSSIDEQRYGEMFMREIRAQADLISDPEVVDYVQSLGQKLVAGTGELNAHFTFFVVKDPEINAFAGPGGYVGVNSGLITTTETESELAAVLAHEISHVTQGHIARSAEFSKKMSIPALAGLAAAILLGMRSPQAGQAAMAAVAGTQAQMQINFTRTEEEEADRIGMQDLYDSGFDPRAMPTFFERMQQATRYDTRPPAFLLDHPVTTVRISDALNRAEAYPYKQYPDSLTYHLVRAKLKVDMAKDPKNAAQQFAEALQSGQYRNETATRFGLVVALTAAGQTERARQALQPLLKADPDRIEFQDALARIELAENHVDRAVHIYSGAYQLYPDDRVVVLGYCQALLHARRPERVVQVLENTRQNGTLDPQMYHLLAQAYEEQGKDVESKLALSEYYFRMGQLQSAIHQLKLAEKSPGRDFYQSSRIEARLKTFEAEKKERDKEKQ